MSIEEELNLFSQEVKYVKFTLTKKNIKIFCPFYYENRFNTYPRLEKKDLYNSYQRYVSYKSFLKLKNEWKTKKRTREETMEFFLR